MRAATAARGLARMREDARAAGELLRPASGAAHALACLLEGVADHLLGDARTGDEAARGGRAARGGPRTARPCVVPGAARRRWRSSATTGTS